MKINQNSHESTVKNLDQTLASKRREILRKAFFSFPSLGYISAGVRFGLFIYVLTPINDIFPLMTDWRDYVSYALWPLPYRLCGRGQVKRSQGSTEEFLPQEVKG